MTPLFATNGLMSLLLIVAVFVGFSMLLQRPLKKQAAEAARVRESVTEGTRVVLVGGLFGTVTHVGEKQAVVELAPGTEVTILKTSISRIVDEGEEEFVFADDVADRVVEPDELPNGGPGATAWEPSQPEPPAHTSVEADPLALETVTLDGSAETPEPQRRP